MARNRVLVAEARHIAARLADDVQVAPAGRDPDGAGREAPAVLRLEGGQPGRLGEPGGQPRPVKLGGMCWTTTMGQFTPRRPSTTLQTAGTPPVEAPMQMHALAVEAGGLGGAERRAWDAGSRRG